MHWCGTDGLTGVNSSGVIFINTPISLLQGDIP